MRARKEQQAYEEKFPLTDEFMKEHKRRSSFQFYDCGWKCAAQIALCSCKPNECNGKCKFYPKDTIHFINALHVLNRHSELREFIYELKKVMDRKTDEESVKAIKDAMEKKLKWISQ